LQAHIRKCRAFCNKCAGWFVKCLAHAQLWRGGCTQNFINPFVPMLEFHFIRHAESMGNLRPEIVSGQSNHYPLSELGRKQAKWLAQRYPDLETHFSRYRFWSSPAVRTQETAQIFFDQFPNLSPELQTSELLLELHQGDWVGRARNEVYTEEVLAQIQADNWNFKAPNGESQRTVEMRMLAWLEAQIQTFADQDLTFLVFTHGVAIKCLLRGIMQSDARMNHKIRIDNTSISQINHTPRGWSLERVNDAGHIF
jgi:broad specificity phosphatase PhoE